MNFLKNENCNIRTLISNVFDIQEYVGILEDIF